MIYIPHTSLRFLLLCSIFFYSTSFAQTIHRFAGTGTIGFSGDLGSATAAQFHSPAGMCRDAIGNIYIADYDNGYIRKVDTAGIITTLADSSTNTGGPATAAYFSQPHDVKFDGHGNMYVGGWGHIYKVDTHNIITTIAGTTTGLSSAIYSGDGGPATAALISNVWALAFDRTGNLYFADSYNDRVRRVDTAGIITTVAGGGSSLGDGGPATAANLKWPAGVDVDTAGNLYISDYHNNRIRKVDAAGIITTVVGNGTVTGYTDIGDGGPATDARVCMPGAIKVLPSGTIFFADQGYYKVRRVDPSGIITTIAGSCIICGSSGDGGLATAAALAPTGLVIDTAGYIYVSDFPNNNVRKIIMGGPITALSTPAVQSDNYNLLAWPQPSDGNLSLLVSSPVASKMDIVITDLAGRVVNHSSGETNKKITIQLHQPAGMYTVTASTASGTRTTTLLIK